MWALSPRAVAGVSENRFAIHCAATARGLRCNIDRTNSARLGSGGSIGASNAAAALRMQVVQKLHKVNCFCEGMARMGDVNKAPKIRARGVIAQTEADARKLASAASLDEGNRSMRRGGRTAWSLADRNAAVDAYEVAMKGLGYPVPAMKGMTPMGAKTSGSKAAKAFDAALRKNARLDQLAITAEMKGLSGPKLRAFLQDRAEQKYRLQYGGLRGAETAEQVSKAAAELFKLDNPTAKSVTPPVKAEPKPNVPRSARPTVRDQRRGFGEYYDAAEKRAASMPALKKELLAKTAGAPVKVADAVPHKGTKIPAAPKSVAKAAKAEKATKAPKTASKRPASKTSTSAPATPHAAEKAVRATERREAAVVNKQMAEPKAPTAAAETAKPARLTPYQQSLQAPPRQLSHARDHTGALDPLYTSKSRRQLVEEGVKKGMGTRAELRALQPEALAKRLKYRGLAGLAVAVGVGVAAGLAARSSSAVAAPASTKTRTDPYTTSDGREHRNGRLIIRQQ